MCTIYKKERSFSAPCGESAASYQTRQKGSLDCQAHCGGGAWQVHEILWGRVWDIVRELLSR